MPEIKCPMCSALNAEDADECVACGARLTPLIVGQEPSRDAGASEQEAADWLSRIREDVRDEGLSSTPSEGPDSSPEPDWLGDMPEASQEEEGPPEGELPDWMDEFVAAGEAADSEEETPEWLSRIRARKESQPLTEETASEDQDWLERLRTDEEPPTEDGLSDLAPSEEKSVEEPLPQSRPLDLGALSDVPDFPPSAEATAAAVPPSEIQPEPPSPIEGPLEESSAVPHISPDEPEEEAELPHIPALVIPSEGEAPVVEIDDISLESIELPDWLGAPKAEAPVEGGGEERDINLAPATLPSWLEAMRPVDTFQTDIDIEPEEVEQVESAGPLAGLRGVLIAEPVVAMPRASTASAARLEVTERQYAQAELLHRLVEDEQRDQVKVPPEPIRVPIVRWVVSAVLCVAVLLPFFFNMLGISGFALPAVVPQDLGALITTVEGIPTGKPVLVVFDYAPGYSAELEAVAGTVINHTIARGLPIITISTTSSGPLLAQRMIQEAAAEGTLENGQDYLHLGYLPGGASAIQLFSITPKEAAPDGFMLPESLGDASAWDSNLLQGVNQLSDFGMVVVITAGTESARAWAEQTHPWIGDTPLVMVLSAGAEPLVRPYYESADSQVNGILTGLPSAVVYEQFIARSQNAQSLWNAFGVGTIAIQLILLVGGIYGVIVWATGRTTPFREQ